MDGENRVSKSICTKYSIPIIEGLGFKPVLDESGSVISDITDSNGQSLVRETKTFGAGDYEELYIIPSSNEDIKTDDMSPKGKEIVRKIKLSVCPSNPRLNEMSIGETEDKWENTIVSVKQEGRGVVFNVYYDDIHYFPIAINNEPPLTPQIKVGNGVILTLTHGINGAVCQRYQNKEEIPVEDCNAENYVSIIKRYIETYIYNAERGRGYCWTEKTIKVLKLIEPVLSESISAFLAKWKKDVKSAIVKFEDDGKKAEAEQLTEALEKHNKNYIV